MALVLTEDEEMLREAAAGFLTEKAPVAAFRKVRDARTDKACSPDLYMEMAAMGWTGTLISEEDGGSGIGMVGAGIIAEEMGRHLTASPYISTAIMAATALDKLGGAEQKADNFPGIISGHLLVSLAIDEGRKHRPSSIKMKAERSGNGFRLNGAKTFVADGQIADKLIVAARTSSDADSKDGITLFLIDAETAGIERAKTPMVDSRGYAQIDFTDVEVTADAVLGEIDQGYDGLEIILDAGRAALAAEMTGSAAQAFSMAVNYVTERKQFGVPVGSFQALQHRAAHLYTEIEMARAAVLNALQALDKNADNASRLVSLAKAKAGQVALLAAQEGIQMHGGMGMTDEFDIGLYIKRIKVAGEMFGDASYHGEKLARELGY